MENVIVTVTHLQKVVSYETVYAYQAWYWVLIDVHHINVQLRFHLFIFRFKYMIEKLFWALFGIHNIESLSVTQLYTSNSSSTNSASDKESPFTYDELYSIEISGSVLYSIYCVMVILVFLNLLIAMMSDTYSRVQVFQQIMYLYIPYMVQSMCDHCIHTHST